MLIFIFTLSQRWNKGGKKTVTVKPNSSTRHKICVDLCLPKVYVSWFFWCLGFEGIFFCLSRCLSPSCKDLWVVLMQSASVRV